ncbi:MAG: hypothetical protein RBS39_11740 [Phycisphaerales bacterium]|jgi:hypothetical protein|nr:hypothetical protein [Phycisphaerales bacterium]
MRSTRIDDSTVGARLERLREEHWVGEPPAFEGVAPRSLVRGKQRASRLAIVLCAGALVGSAAYAGYRVVASSWSAKIRVEGERVEVRVNGVVVPPSDVQWLPDGTCMVTINGARVLLDPRQPGGASAEIRVETSEE